MEQLTYLFLNTERKQNCHFTNKDSSMLNFHKGVPQGFVRGPLLYILCIHYLSYSSTRLDLGSMCADDNTLFGAGQKF